MPDAGWWRALWPDPDRIAGVVGAEAGMSALDVGCGSGYFSAALARRVSPGQLIGLDLDPEMLRQAAAACRGLGNCAWKLADAMRLSRVIAIAVDYVLIANTFHGAPDKTGLARQAAAVLKPAGRFVVINWHARPREETTVLGEPRGPPTAMRLCPETTRAQVEPAGFALERLVDLPPYHYASLFRRTARPAGVRRRAQIL